MESDEGADLAWCDTMGPRAELDLNQKAVSHSVAWCGIPTGPRGVSGREERSVADRRRVLAKWRPAPSGGKRSDEARPSLRAKCRWHRSSQTTARRAFECVARRAVVWPRRSSIAPRRPALFSGMTVSRDSARRAGRSLRQRPQVSRGADPAFCDTARDKTPARRAVSAGRGLVPRRLFTPG